MHHCYVCRQFKPRDAFGPDSSRTCGVQNRCRECRRVVHAKHAVKSRERAARYRAANNEKRRAHQAVQNALEQRLIVRAKKCETCRQAKRLDAHHADYSKPLEVHWLCRGCHLALHRAEAAGVVNAH